MLRLTGRSFAIACAAAVAFASQAGAQTPGAAGVGDPYFPNAGNGGYDVAHYDITLGFNPRRDRIRAAAAITATSTQELSEFNLDLRGLKVLGVTVDGAPAAHRERGGELTVTPAAPIPSGAGFTAVVSYAGKPKPITDKAQFPTGWLHTSDGALVFSEPTGAPSWFPCNDHPTDKATYSFTLTVPRGIKAISNGQLESVRRHGGKATFVWRETEPMATYLATVAAGRYRLRHGVAAGFPSWVAIEPNALERRSRRVAAKLPAIITRLGGLLGTYPFASTGVILDSEGPGFILETQTRPLFGDPASKRILVHEMSHQWFGDDVSVRTWRDIWLNEGFATWIEWWWETRGQDAKLKRLFRFYYRTPGSLGYLWKIPPGDPGARKLFSFAVYYRGALTVEALRQKIGDPAFYSLLRDWIAAHHFGNASTQDFIDLAESETGRDLDAFFSEWLFKRGKPKRW